MSPTILDAIYLTSIPSIDAKVDDSIIPLGDISPFNFLNGLGYQDFSECFFLFDPLAPNPNIIEHTVFLLHWLCHFYLMHS